MSTAVTFPADHIDAFRRCFGEGTDVTKLGSNILGNNYNFAALSIRDLLDARDLYHFHLMSKDNVVGTAIGLYLIRSEEPRPEKRGEGGAIAKGKYSYPRTLDNSEVRDYSWPCVLVFVRKWEQPEAFADKPSQAVPKTLYMPDGRAVPVCIVQAQSVSGDEAEVVEPQVWPESKFGGGLPIEVTVQNERHFATAGCLVSDGHLTYVLTARHVCGAQGTPISCRLKSGPRAIGTSSSKQLTRMPFDAVYPDFPGRKSFLTLDVGLVELDDVTAWTSNVYGLPQLQRVADFYEQNLSLGLIDRPVIGAGAASGIVAGRIKALFYRYHSIGGYDYVADFLIAPAPGTTGTRHGDSGMVWNLMVTPQGAENEAPQLHPLCLEWGGQTFDVSGQRSKFAVATSLSNICKLLDVEPVSDNDPGVSGYWGRTGHYSIGRLAVDEVKDRDLKSLLQANAHLLSFSADEISSKTFADKLARATRLADVPDDVWKHMPTGKQAVEGGRDIRFDSGPEHPNHYADIDVPHGGAETFRRLCLDKPDQNLTPAAWRSFYDDRLDQAMAGGNAAEITRAKDIFKKGLLPFRVWQIFDEMQSFARDRQLKDFVCAAGILAHYVGDGSQPLHGSALSDGDPSRPVDRWKKNRNGQMEQQHYGQGAHSAFESSMLDVVAGEGKLFPAVQDKLPQVATPPEIKDGRGAAYAVVELMDKVAAILPPGRILDVYESTGAADSAAKATREAMWQKLGGETATVIAYGVRYLAAIWEAAWLAGRGRAAAETFSLDDMKARYTKSDFLQSYTLDQIDRPLGLAASAPAPSHHRSRPPRGAGRETRNSGASRSRASAGRS